MSRKPKQASNAAGLRRRAEAGLRRRAVKPGSAQPPPKPATPPIRLLHELQVHQVELEMQNAELREVRDRMETLLEKYTDLYDFAPVGYFSLDRQGRILDVNLTGSLLLNIQRPQLLGMRLVRLVAPSSPPVFPGFLELLFSGATRPTCELILSRRGRGPFWASCHGSLDPSTDPERRTCRVAVSDVSVLKEAEAVRHRLESLAQANLELKQEIVRRRAVEEALRKSEQSNADLLKLSHLMQAKLRRLSHALLHAQEEERRRISRELHDQITQTLVGINVHLETLARNAHISPAKLRRDIVRTQGLVETSVKIVHDFARKLRPSLLDDLGLIASLRSFLKDFTRDTGIRVSFSTFAGVDRLNNDRCIVLYRVAHSALTNVSQHAEASQVTVDIRKIGRSVQMEITDNGRSFDVQRVLNDPRNKRLGFLGMRERVEMVGGSLTIESFSGRGTTIRALIPIHSASRTQPNRTL